MHWRGGASCRAGGGSDGAGSIMSGARGDGGTPHARTQPHADRGACKQARARPPQRLALSRPYSSVPRLLRKKDTRSGRAAADLFFVCPRATWTWRRVSTSWCLRGAFFRPTVLSMYQLRRRRMRWYRRKVDTAAVCSFGRSFLKAVDQVRRLQECKCHLIGCHGRLLGSRFACLSIAPS